MTPEQEERLHRQLNSIGRQNFWLAVLVCWLGLLWAFHLLFPTIMQILGYGG